MRVLRLLATPRWIGLTAVMLAAVAGCVVLGTWQLHRAQDALEVQRAHAAEVVALDELAPAGSDLPGDVVGRPVHAEGTWRGDEQLLVANRQLDGRSGSWVLTGLALPDGTVLAVVRGWVPGLAAAAPDPGAVQVTGRLQESEAFYSGTAARPDGRLTRVDTAELRARWGDTVRSGFLVLAAQQPAAAAAAGAAPAPAVVPAPVVPDPDGGFPWQNAAYTAQWWIFAGFAVALWARWLLDDARRGARRDDPDGADDADGAAGPAGGAPGAAAPASPGGVRRAPG